MEDLVISEECPIVEEYIELRKAVKWRVIDIENIEKGLKNSIYSVCIRDKNRMIGFGRIVGDGGTVFYIQDIIVDPQYQNKKIGTKIMEKIMNYIENNCSKDAIIGLIAISELNDFYSKFRFVHNENNYFYRLNM
ncbi:GNAT family N-acetyltransferase [Clostridium sp. UBA6640]|uniref:GNAT family N-acetyltransferase n=1 Tax=Clostridium sp. UBA6640 TaxID=1946370 RepID=UPI0025C57174|nr:GNAT family N-acetyltransferase [Clostridium sp. UBA6640]